MRLLAVALAMALIGIYWVYHKKLVARVEPRVIWLLTVFGLLSAMMLYFLSRE